MFPIYNKHPDRFLFGEVSMWRSARHQVYTLYSWLDRAGFQRPGKVAGRLEQLGVFHNSSRKFARVSNEPRNGNPLKGAAESCRLGTLLPSTSQLYDCIFKSRNTHYVIKNFLISRLCGNSTVGSPRRALVRHKLNCQMKALHAC